MVMMQPIMAYPPCRTGASPSKKELLHRRHDGGVDPVKAGGLHRMANRGLVAITIALAMALPGAAAVAQEADRGFERPAPHVERQIDRLDRRGSVDPQTRRRLQDQLRREPRGAERSAAERALDRLPEDAPARDAPPPPAPESAPLPSSLPPGFAGGRGGPGAGGYTVPPGGRSGGRH
jgi:hypothetical protein